MGITDFGTQNIIWNYKAPGKSSGFNKLNYDILPVGIYKGGLLTKINATTVQISPFTCFIEDTANGVGVKISTAATVNITVATSTPYLIIRYGFSNVENNYADIIAIDYASIDSKDIIIGRCAYDSGNNLQTTFDYTRRTISSLQDLDDSSLKLKVTPTEPPTNIIQVSAGNILVSNNPFTFTGGTSGAITDTINGRIDLVYIDDSGNLQILEGTDSATPTQPDFPIRGYTLAKITRGAGESTIRGDEIESFNFNAISGGNKITFQPDTAANWATNNPVLSQGEGAIETDTGKTKIGDGLTAYNSLWYANSNRYYYLDTSSDGLDLTATFQTLTEFSKTFTARANHRYFIMIKQRIHTDSQGNYTRSAEFRLNVNGTSVGYYGAAWYAPSTSYNYFEVTLEALVGDFTEGQSVAITVDAYVADANGTFSTYYVSGRGYGLTIIELPLGDEMSVT